ncbi:hypothetical protein B0H13DRAFT_1851325 [Mycena leptocephala]|nr:hypothetical protein B0H13DRAFT_1851325 [Mycena leptocephala]
MKDQSSSRSTRALEEGQHGRGGVRGGVKGWVKRVRGRAEGREERGVVPEEMEMEFEVEGKLGRAAVDAASSDHSPHLVVGGDGGQAEVKRAQQQLGRAGERTSNSVLLWPKRENHTILALTLAVFPPCPSPIAPAPPSPCSTNRPESTQASICAASRQAFPSRREVWPRLLYQWQHGSMQYTGVGLHLDIGEDGCFELTAARRNLVGDILSTGPILRHKNPDV